MRKRNDAYKSILNRSVNTSYSMSMSRSRDRRERERLKEMSKDEDQFRLFDEKNNPTEYAQKIINQRLNESDFNRQVFGMRHRDEQMFLENKFEDKIKKDQLTEFLQFENDRLMYKKDTNIQKQTRSLRKLDAKEFEKLDKLRNIHNREFTQKEKEKKVKDQASTIASDINKNMKKMNNLTKEVTQAETF